MSEDEVKSAASTPAPGATGGPVDINKLSVTLLFICSGGDSLENVANYLNRRGWHTKITSDVKGAFQEIGLLKPDFVLFSINTGGRRLLQLPNVIFTTFKVPVVTFAESFDVKSQKALLDTTSNYTLEGPASGPSVHRRIKNILNEIHNPQSSSGDKKGVLGDASGSSNTTVIKDTQGAQTHNGSSSMFFKDTSKEHGGSASSDGPSAATILKGAPNTERGAMYGLTSSSSQTKSERKFPLSHEANEKDASLNGRNDSTQGNTPNVSAGDNRTGTDDGARGHSAAVEARGNTTATGARGNGLVNEAGHNRNSSSHGDMPGLEQKNATDHKAADENDTSADKRPSREKSSSRNKREQAKFDKEFVSVGSSTGSRTESNAVDKKDSGKAGKRGKTITELSPADEGPLARVIEYSARAAARMATDPKNALTAADRCTFWPITYDHFSGLVMVAHAGTPVADDQFNTAFFEKLKAEGCQMNPQLKIAGQISYEIEQLDLRQKMKGELITTRVQSANDEVIVKLLSLMKTAPFTNKAKDFPGKLNIRIDDLAPDLSPGVDLYIYLPQNKRLIHYIKREAILSGKQHSKLEVAKTNLFIDEKDIEDFRSAHSRNQTIKALHDASRKKKKAA